MNSMAALRIVLQWLSTKTQNATKSKKTRAYRQQAARLLAMSSTMIMQTLETREVLSKVSSPIFEFAFDQFLNDAPVCLSCLILHSKWVTNSNLRCTCLGL
jgi:hypothetical protein